MDSLIDFAKHNYDLITLFVAMLGVLVAVISLFYELGKKKRQKAEKAQAAAAESSVKEEEPAAEESAEKQSES